VSRGANLNGDDPRLSAIEKKYDLRIVDPPKFKRNDFSNHSKFLTAPAQLQALAAAHARDPQEPAFNKGGVVVYNAANPCSNFACRRKRPDWSAIARHFRRIYGFIWLSACCIGSGDTLTNPTNG
jgi:hypothetical protein